MKALILVGGFGTRFISFFYIDSFTRLRPLTFSYPKPVISSLKRLESKQI